MNTINNLAVTQEAQKKPLPPLIKQSTTYKLVVPSKVEEKIRYLIRKFPHTEWSGVLFYKYTGTFEDNTLTLTCEDFFPMDLGTGGWTELKMNEDVAAYIADNLELFDCEIGLIHSHHSLGAFISGQDFKRLNEDGDDTNCFLSLVVDTKGTYVAALTRKVQAKKEVVTKFLDTSYEFFGEGPKYLGSHGTIEKQTFIDDSIIQYFMLDVEVEKVDNPLEYLDARFVEIEEKKKAEKPVTTGFSRVYDPKKGDTVLLPKAGNDYDKDIEFYDWIHSERNKSAEVKEALLFDKETMQEITDASKWQPDPTIIHHLTAQLLTCSLIVNKDIDLKQWVTRHMVNKYSEIFGGTGNLEFDNWSEWYVEFIMNHYNDSEVPADLYDDWDLYISRIAGAILDELSELPTNVFIELYVDVLERYLQIEA